MSYQMISSILQHVLTYSYGYFILHALFIKFVWDTCKVLTLLWLTMTKCSLWNLDQTSTFRPSCAAWVGYNGNYDTLTLEQKNKKTNFATYWMWITQIQHLAHKFEPFQNNLLTLKLTHMMLFVYRLHKICLAKTI